MVKGTITFVIAVLAAAHFLVEHGEALSCSDILPATVQCAPYATGAVPQPSTGCCQGISRLNGMAGTTAARQQICNCLKQFAPQYPNVKDSLLSSLPKKCGVPLPFTLSRSTNCNG
ncbi:unnamed protein product [Ilex paraguariensis]|uniref:Non-specific lipid-transfer protein n=1 Tax=Ilex paraguariensis TaxID=185542 RepID=A0ABC8UEC2_9AQUA